MDGVNRHHAIIAIIAALSAGCAYLDDRASDLRDCFKASGGVAVTDGVRTRRESPEPCGKNEVERQEVSVFMPGGENGARSLEISFGRGDCSEEGRVVERW